MLLGVLLIPLPLLGQMPPQQPGQPVQRRPPPPPRVQTPLYPFWFPLIVLPIVLFLIHQARQQKKQQQKKQRDDEEENRTPYTEDDLMQDWEFKILHCYGLLFVRGGGLQPEFLRFVLAEEAQNGWQLVEVFDCQRIRLKRLADRRGGDVSLPGRLDPYRLVVFDPRRSFDVLRALSWLAVSVGILAALIGFPFFLFEPGARFASGIVIGISGLWALAFGFLAVFTRIPPLPNLDFPDEPPQGPPPSPSTAIRSS
jgi:hypothetical protein